MGDAEDVTQRALDRSMGLFTSFRSIVQDGIKSAAAMVRVPGSTVIDQRTTRTRDPTTQRINRAREADLKHLKVSELPAHLFDSGPSAQKEAIRRVLVALSEEDKGAPEEESGIEFRIMKQIEYHDAFRLKIQQDLADHILANYKDFMTGMQHIRATEVDLAWALKFCSEAKNSLKDLETNFKNPSLQVLKQYQQLQRLSWISFLASGAKELIEREKRLSNVVNSGDFSEAIVAIEEYAKVSGQDSVRRPESLKSMSGITLKIAKCRSKLEKQLLRALTALCDQYTDKKFQEILKAFEGLERIKNLEKESKAEVESIDSDFRSVFVKKLEKIAFLSLCKFSNELPDLSEADKLLEIDSSKSIRSIVLSVGPDNAVKAFIHVVRGFCTALRGFHLMTSVIVNVKTDCFAIEQLKTAFRSNKGYFWEKVQEVMNIMVESLRLTAGGAKADDVVLVLRSGYRLITIGDKFSSSEGSKSRRKLNEALLKKCKDYVENLVRVSFEFLLPSIRNDDWTLFPVTPDILMKELKITGGNSVTMIDYDADYLFEVFESGGDVFKSMETASVSESLSAEEIRISLGEGNDTLLDDAIITNSSMTVFRFFGIYSHVLKTLSPVRDDVYQCIVELVEFYAYSLFTCFGFNTAGLLDTRSHLKSRYPIMVKFLNDVRERITKGTFACGFFEGKTGFDDMDDPESSLVTLHPFVQKHLETEEGMYGVIERCAASEALAFVVKIARWSAPRISHMFSDEFYTRFSSFVTKMEKFCDEFSTHIFRNLVVDMWNAVAISSLISRGRINWNVSDDSASDTEYNEYVPIFVDKFKSFQERLKIFLSAASLPSSVLFRVVAEVLRYAMESLVDAYSKVSSCSFSGRAQMSGDLNQIVRKLEAISVVKYGLSQE